MDVSGVGAMTILRSAPHDPVVVATRFGLVTPQGVIGAVTRKSSAERQALARNCDPASVRDNEDLPVRGARERELERCL